MRAISPVVATLILIIVAVVAGVAVYGFVTGFIAQTTSQSQSPSSIVIDAAIVDDDAGTYTVNATVRNIGQESTTVTAVYVLDAGDLSLIGSDTSVSVSINPGNAVTVNANPTLPDLDGQWVIVKVVTDDGSSATLKVKGS